MTTKIGILTHHSVYNFGANLQALSTQECLRSKGFDAYIVNWVPQDLRQYYLSSTPTCQVEVHESFFNKYYCLTELCRNSQDIAYVLENEGFDAVVIGSDAVIRHFSLLYRYTPCRKGFRKNNLNSTDIFPNPYWGDFNYFLHKKLPIAMMSVSSQGTMWRSIRFLEKMKIKKALSSMSYLSVRDTFTRDAISYFTKGEIVPSITPDPVFSFNQNLRLPDCCQKEKYVIFSFKKATMPSNEWLKNLKNIFNKNGYEVLSLPFPQEECSFEVDKKISLPLSPIEWYQIIKQSSGYIGNNMHPLVVALHNDVPIFAFDYYAVKPGWFSKPNITMSKIYDLLVFAGLEDNYFNILEGYSNIPTCEYVYDKVTSLNAEKLKLFSNKMKIKYDSMIDNMLSNLIEK